MQRIIAIKGGEAVKVRQKPRTFNCSWFWILYCTMDTMNEWTSSYSMNESKKNEDIQRTEYHNHLIPRIKNAISYSENFWTYLYSSMFWKRDCITRQFGLFWHWFRGNTSFSWFKIFISFLIFHKYLLFLQLLTLMRNRLAK